MLELHADAIVVVKRIFELAEAGTGMLQISRTLNDEGIPSPAGKRWSKNVILYILRNEVNTGILVWGISGKGKGNPIRVEEAFPADVSNSKFRRVNRMMQSRIRKVAHAPQSGKLLPAQRARQVQDVQQGAHQPVLQEATG